MEREEARVLHLLLRPAEFEEVVRCLQPLLHLGIVLDDNAVEDSVNRPRLSTTKGRQLKGGLYRRTRRTQYIWREYKRAA